MTDRAKLRLGVNIDHVATLRNARGGEVPSPVRAALLAEAAGADGITAHLREDRRHIVDADIDALMDALRIGDTVAIMREEGLIYADQVAGAMLPDTDPEDWRAHVSRIYDTDRMQRLVEEGVRQSLDGADLAPMLDFYNSEAGRRAVEMELAARRGFLDPVFRHAAGDERLGRAGRQRVRNRRGRLRDAQIAGVKRHQPGIGRAHGAQIIEAGRDDWLTFGIGKTHVELPFQKNRQIGGGRPLSAFAACPSRTIKARAIPTP